MAGWLDSYIQSLTIIRLGGKVSKALWLSLTVQGKNVLPVLVETGMVLRLTLTNHNYH